MTNWSDDEIKILNEMNNKDHTLKDIAIKLNRNKGAVRHKIQSLGLSYNYKKERGNYNDVIGLRCGHVTIIKFIERKNKTNYYLCRCDCGNEKIFSSRDLLYGKNPNLSCGCKTWAKTNKVDVMGQRFGRLVAIRDTGKRVHGEVLWECLCDCGNICCVTGYNLRNGHTKSCGCYNRERIIETNKKENKFDMQNFPWGVGWTSNTNDIFIFDKEDFDKIKDYCWRLDAYGYIVTRIDGKTIKFHRVIMDVNNSHILVDHIKHDKRDNRKSRLRLVTTQQNTKNRIPTNESGVSGVNWDKNKGKWVVQITHNYKNIYIGTYDFMEDAIEARLKANEKYCGQYSYEKSMAVDKEVS